MSKKSILFKYKAAVAALMLGVFSSHGGEAASFSGKCPNLWDIPSLKWKYTEEGGAGHYVAGQFIKPTEFLSSWWGYLTYPNLKEGQNPAFEDEDAVSYVALKFINHANKTYIQCNYKGELEGGLGETTQLSLSALVIQAGEWQCKSTGNSFQCTSGAAKKVNAVQKKKSKGSK